MSLIAALSCLVAGPACTLACVFEPSLNEWVEAGRLTTARRGHTSTVLADGRVLLAGGLGTASAELYASIANGESCIGAGECDSKNCVEGVCCDTPCTNGCSSCVESQTGVPDGTCAPILAGTDPKHACSTAGTSGSTC